MAPFATLRVTNKVHFSFAIALSATARASSSDAAVIHTP